MPKQTGYARDPKASDRDAIQDALELLRSGQDHRQGLREDIWRKVDRQYKGEQWSIEAFDDPTATLTVINMSFATIQTIKPYITDQEPRFYLEPFSSDATRLSAALQEVFLNRLWRHPPVGAQVALRAATFDYLKFGDGFLKGTYKINQRINEIGEPAGYAEIFVDKVSPWDIWIDPYSEGITSARWVAHRIWLTEKEAEADERFEIPASFEFTDRRIEDDDRQNRTNVGLSEGQQWVQLIEFYDVTDGVMYAFPMPFDGTDGGSAPSAQLPWQVIEDIEILPIVQMPNYDVGDSPWHMGELEQIAQLQDELNRTRSELMTHRRRNVAKTFIRKGVVDPDAEAALQSPIVNEIVEIDTQEPLQNVVQAYQQTQITADNYGATREIKDDIREITGITEYQRGIAPEITRTATEASIMDAAANVKLGSKLTAVEEASRRLGTIILGLAREVFPETDPDEWAMFIGGQEAQRLARAAQGSQVDAALQGGDMAAAAEISQQALPDSVIAKPTNQMFAGDYEVLVETGSTEYRDPKAKEERLRSMFFEIAQMAPQLAQMGVNFDLAQMARLWLESTDIIDVDSLLPGAPQGPPGMPPQEMLPPGEEAGGLPPELMAMLSGGGMPAQPAPQDMQQTSNTGMLETGEIAPATPRHRPTPFLTSLNAGKVGNGMVEGISTVEEAYAAAKAEMGINPEVAPEGVGTSTPPAPAPSETEADQPSTNPETQALVDSLVEQPSEADEGSLPPGFWNQTVEVDGAQVQLNELKNGYLRHSDYTRKTQALADQRRTIEAAAKFYEDFTADPVDFSKALAVQYGWIDNEDVPLREVALPEQISQQEWDARIDQLVEERLESDPRIEAAQKAEAEQMLGNEFGRLEGLFGVTLNPEVRTSLLTEAAERQVYDLELLLRARINAQMDKQKASQNLARSGSSRPNGGGGSGSDPTLGQNPEPQTVEEAWAQAKVEAGR